MFYITEVKDKAEHTHTKNICLSLITMFLFWFEAPSDSETLIWSIIESHVDFWHLSRIQKEIDK